LTEVATSLSPNRGDLLRRELDRYVAVLVEQMAPDKVIAFGSLASGEPHAESDIDLVVVARTDLPFWKRLRKVRRLLQPRVATDLLVYTPEEFEVLCRERPFIREEILVKGRVVYERSG
jgi:predicted nucleotidyltransferase